LKTYRQLNEPEKNLMPQKMVEELCRTRGLNPAQKFETWMESQSHEQGLSEDVVHAYALANPLGMSADGLMRYWKKVRMGGG
jgi:hypothetical protein